MGRKNFELEPLHPENLEMEEELADIRLNLTKENQRLKEQLKDYENALKEYACEFCYSDSYDIFPRSSFICEYNGKDYTNNELAQETLKKWEDK